MSRSSIICRSRIIDLLASDKSRYFAQPRPIHTIQVEGKKKKEQVVVYNIFVMIEFLMGLQKTSVLNAESLKHDLRTFAPQNFPRTDFFKTLTAGRQ